MALSNPTNVPTLTQPVAGAATGAPLLALTRVELRIGLRGAAFRLTSAALFLLGIMVGGQTGRGASLSAYTVAETATQYLSLLAIIWMALVAVRESSMRTDIVVFSKPQPADRLALAKFSGAFGQILLMTLALFAGAMLSRLYVGHSLIGFAVYPQEYLRVIAALFFASAASYTLALLFNTPLAGAVVGLYWVLTLAGSAFLAKVYFPSYSQNAPHFILFGIALLGIGLWFYRRRSRGGAMAPFWIRITTPLALLGSLFLLLQTLYSSHDPNGYQNPALENMTQQNLVIGNRTPGFLLPSQNGHNVKLSDFPNKILVIGVWSPHEPESITLLDYFETIYARYGAQGVQPVAICISEDNSTGSAFARGESLSYPVVMDWGTHNAVKTADMSPMTTAYRTESLPNIVITDRQHRATEVLFGVDAYEGNSLQEAVEYRLKQEPK